MAKCVSCGTEIAESSRFCPSSCGEKVGAGANMQATPHSGAWYLGNTLFLLACFLGLALWSCYTSMAGQKLWKTSLFET